MITYQIVEAPIESKLGYRPFGGALKFWLSKNHEVILAGPAETGKTRAVLEKIDALAWKYPNLRVAIVRKTYQSAVTSVIQTYQNKVLGAWDAREQHFDPNLTPVAIYGGSKPEWYDYPNGSRIVIGGMDKPGKFLSSEYDMIFVNQAEEIELAHWETLMTRATGRAGNMPYAQMVGDANPGAPTHWILGRRDESHLQFIESRHEDNPVLFDPDTGQLTDQGQRSMAALDKLTGVRKLRLRDGKWAQAEGVVYEEYNRSVHLIPRFEIPADWARFRVVDFGYTNPFVCQWWALDHDDRMYRYREIYMTGRTVKVHSGKIKELSDGEHIAATICDHDAEDMATLRENGIPTTPARKAVSVGIQKVQERLKPAGDGKPRIFFLEDSLVEIDHSLKEQHKPICTEQEFESYLWSNRARKDEPVKENDHGMDCTRYGVMHRDGSRTWARGPAT